MKEIAMANWQLDFSETGKDNVALSGMVTVPVSFCDFAVGAIFRHGYHSYAITRIPRIDEIGLSKTLHFQAVPISIEATDGIGIYDDDTDRLILTGQHEKCGKGRASDVRAFLNNAEVNDDDL